MGLQFLFSPIVLSLKCFVGSGNSSLVLPATADEMAAHENDQGDKVFKILRCGSKNSNLVNFEKIAKDVKNKVSKKSKVWAKGIPKIKYIRLTYHYIYFRISIKYFFKSQFTV